jgi:hypothetical protein
VSSPAPVPSLPNEELVIQGLVDLVAQKFIAEFGKGGCSRGVPDTNQMPEETPWVWLSQGETEFAPCDNGYPWAITDVGIAVRVFPAQADQAEADVYGQRAVWTMVNRAKFLLDRLILPPKRTVNGIPGVQIKPNGKPNRYLGEAEAWLSYPLLVAFPTGLDSTMAL